MNAFLKKFGFEIDSALIEPYYQAAQAEHAQRKNEIFDFEKYGAFPTTTPVVAAIRDRLLDDPDNALYCYMFAGALRDENADVYNKIASPCHDLHSELFDTLPLFGMLDLLPEMLAEHKQRGIPEEITRATVEMFENQVGDFIALHGHHGISTYAFWMILFLKCRIIRVGRFNFEVKKFTSHCDVFERNGELCILAKDQTYHRSGRVLGSVDCTDEQGSFYGNIEETDDAYIGLPIVNALASPTPVTLLKSEWRRVLTQGDTVISVHIPSGGPMTPEICDRDIARARELFPRCFGPFNAFFCGSWLLSTEIKEATGKESNVTRFGDRFARYPSKVQGKAVYAYVFGCSADTPVEDLPEKSSLAKAIKEYMLAGGHIYELSGVFL